MNVDKLKDYLFDLLKSKGAALLGVADLTSIPGAALKTGISVAVPVPRHIVEDLKTAPTEEYYHMYYTLNTRLNEIVESGASYLQEQGYRAYANTTTAVQIDENWRTPLPHKTVATRAGLGWIGKSCLLVTTEYGSAVRLSSIVTDAPLPTNPPVVESKCGNCSKCVDMCPAQALSGALWKAGMPRETLFKKEICKKVQTERMQKATGIETDLCGMCFAVCPYTQKYLKQD